MSSRKLRFSVLVLVAVLVLAPLALLPLPKREVPTVEAASHTQIGLTAPFLGDFSRQVPRGDIRHIDTQMQIIQSYQVRTVSIWGEFQRNFLRADDIDRLYQAGVRTFVVRVGSEAPCQGAAVQYPLTYNFITTQLSMARPYNNSTASLVQRLNAYLSSDSSVRVYIQLGNEADLNYNGDCDNTKGEIEDLQAYSNAMANLAPQVRTWINQNFGNNTSRVYLSAGTTSANIDKDITTLQREIDAVFSNSNFLQRFDAFSINVYAHERFYHGSLNNPINTVQAMRYLKSKVGSKPVYVGETGVGAVQNLTGFGLPNVVAEGSGNLRQPGIVRGFSIREMIRDNNNNISFALLFTLGCWYESSPDLVTTAQCGDPSTAVRPFQVSVDNNNNVTLTTDYRQGFSRNRYILDRALLDTVFAFIAGSGANFNPACVYSGTGCTRYNYVADGSESVGGSIYIYGNRLGWWFNTATNHWFLVTERGALSETQVNNLELGIRRAIRAGYLCENTSSSECKDTGRWIGGYRLILRCQEGTGAGNCFLRNINGERKRNPFDYASVVRDSAACPYFDTQTGFQVCGHFWHDHIRLMGRQSGAAGITDAERIALVGRPISTHFHETVVIGSNTCHYLVQYFERGVLRYEHPNGLAPGSSSNCPRTTQEPWDAPLIRLGAGIPRTYATQNQFDTNINGTVIGFLDVYRMR